jgi:hypothetical protein
MSALGIWNNRYEGGPCYAACMETFTLYLSIYQATILPSQSAGKAATMPQDELMMTRDANKLEECANVLLQSRWVLKLANCRE